MLKIQPSKSIVDRVISIMRLTIRSDYVVPKDSFTFGFIRLDSILPTWMYAAGFKSRTTVQQILDENPFPHVAANVESKSREVMTSQTDYVHRHNLGLSKTDFRLNEQAFITQVIIQRFNQIIYRFTRKAWI